MENPASSQLSSKPIISFKTCSLYQLNEVFLRLSSSHWGWYFWEILYNMVLVPNAFIRSSLQCWHEARESYCPAHYNRNIPEVAKVMGGAKSVGIRIDCLDRIIRKIHKEREFNELVHNRTLVEAGRGEDGEIEDGFHLRLWLWNPNIQGLWHCQIIFSLVFVNTCIFILFLVSLDPNLYYHW